MTVHNLICIVFDKKTIKTIITYNQLQAIEHAHFVGRIFSDQRNLLIRVFKRLTTAFLGLACSWDISSSCSGVHTRTLLSTLNHPLHRRRGCHHVKAMKSDRDRCLFLLLAVYGQVYVIPRILRRLCEHLVCPLIGHNVQSVLLFMVIHNLPMKS